MTCRCGRETRDAEFVCDACVRQVQRELGEFPYYAEQLQISLTRQGRFGGYRIGSRSSDRPLPFDWAASVTIGTLVNTLTSWARTIGAPPENTISGLCLFLIQNAGWARTSPEGPQMVDEVHYLSHELKQRVDRPPDWYAGPCLAVSIEADVVQTAPNVIALSVGSERVCTATLWTRLDSKVIICRECKTKRLTSTRRDWLVLQVSTALVPLNMLVDALPTLIGVTVSRDTARKWVARGRLQPRGLAADGSELFSGGDIIELARNSTRRKVPA